MDQFPKKKCKYCGLMGHFPYACYQSPKRALKALKRTELKRSTKPIKKIGKLTKQWYITRATWIRKNPPPMDGRFWKCYLHIHPWCPGQVGIHNMTLDHIVSRSHAPGMRFSASNLRPACKYCNTMKGSRSIEQVKAGMV